MNYNFQVNHYEKYEYEIESIIYTDFYVVYKL